MGKRKLKKIEKKLRKFAKRRRFMEYGERNRQETILLRLYTNELHKKIGRLEKQIEDKKEEIIDIIDSENSGLSHQDRLNEITKIVR